ANVTVVAHGLSDAAGATMLFQEGNDIGGGTPPRAPLPPPAEPPAPAPRGAPPGAGGARAPLINNRTPGGGDPAARRLPAHTPPDTVVLAEITDSWLRGTGASAAALFALMAGQGYRPYEVYLRRSIVRSSVGLEPLARPLDAYQYDVLFTRAPSAGAFWAWA